MNNVVLAMVLVVVVVSSCGTFFMERLNLGLVELVDLVVIAHKQASADGAFARWVCHRLNGALKQLFALFDLARAQLALGDGAKRPRSGSHMSRSLGRLRYARRLVVNIERNRSYASKPPGRILQLLGFPCLLVLPGHSPSTNFGGMQLKGCPRLGFSNQMEPCSIVPSVKGVTGGKLRSFLPTVRPSRFACVFEIDNVVIAPRRRGVE